MDSTDPTLSYLRKMLAEECRRRGHASDKSGSNNNSRNHSTSSRLCKGVSVPLIPTRTAKLNRIVSLEQRRFEEGWMRRQNEGIRKRLLYLSRVLATTFSSENPLHISSPSPAVPGPVHAAPKKKYNFSPHRRPAPVTSGMNLSIRILRKPAPRCKLAPLHVGGFRFPRNGEMKPPVGEPRNQLKLAQEQPLPRKKVSEETTATEEIKKEEGSNTTPNRVSVAVGSDSWPARVCINLPRAHYECEF